MEENLQLFFNIHNDKKLLDNTVTNGKMRVKVLEYGLSFKTFTSEEMEYTEINSQDI